VREWLEQQAAAGILSVDDAGARPEARLFAIPCEDVLLDPVSPLFLTGLARLAVGVLSPIVHAIPVQLLAYHAALARHTDVDKPRNLAKSVTVE